MPYRFSALKVGGTTEARMRVWDINPGYLNRQSLLGEHREIHAVVSILTNEKRGYARHPETRRWGKALWALKIRHDLVVSEMELRGYHHRSPVQAIGAREWPEAFIDTPGGQFALLRAKYHNRAPGRIPLPHTLRQLWAQHEYSVLARDPTYHHGLGALVAAHSSGTALEQLARALVEVLRVPPVEGRLVKALQQMWGHVSARARLTAPDLRRPTVVLATIRALALKHQIHDLLESTALSELSVWMPGAETGTDSIPRAPSSARVNRGCERRLW